MKKYFFAMVPMGMIIAFLLSTIDKRMEYKQGDIESSLPSKQEKEQGVEEEKIIRVLLKTNGFKNKYHKVVEVSAQNGLWIKEGEVQYEYGENEIVKLKDIKESVIITPKEEGDKIQIHTIDRGYGTPGYRGQLEVFSTSEGLVIVNEVPLEEYLFAVVPSEMPSSYHEEALKAQAICARCYAYNQTKTLAYPEYNAHVDDSVSFQVYNNSEEKESTTAAVVETSGEKLWYGKEVAMTYFYSTSSGASTSVEAWGTKLVDANQYLQGVAISNSDGQDYEEGLAWYKWSATISKDTMEELMKKNGKKDIGSLKSIDITKRGTGGVVLEVRVRGTKASFTVSKESAVRKLFGGSGYQITKQDGSTVNSVKLLPSAFFDIEKAGDSYIINGGGYGHGIGMSQNGANELAKAGMDYIEILEFFYPGTKVE